MTFWQLCHEHYVLAFILAMFFIYVTESIIVDILNLSVKRMNMKLALNKLKGVGKK